MRFCICNGLCVGYMTPACQCPSVPVDEHARRTGVGTGGVSTVKVDLDHTTLEPEGASFQSHGSLFVSTEQRRDVCQFEHPRDENESTRTRDAR